MFALFRRAHQSLQSLFARAHQAVRTRLVVTSSMVCGTFLKNGKPETSKSCQVFDYDKDPESLQDVQIARERVLLTGEEASLSPFTTPAFG